MVELYLLSRTLETGKLLQILYYTEVFAVGDFPPSCCIVLIIVLQLKEQGKKRRNSQEADGWCGGL